MRSGFNFPVTLTGRGGPLLNDSTILTPASRPAAVRQPFSHWHARRTPLNDWNYLRREDGSGALLHLEDDERHTAGTNRNLPSKGERGEKMIQFMK
jgi:hypothetical protein